MLVGERIYLRHYTQDDVQAYLDYLIHNRKFFSPYIIEQEEPYYTLEQQQRDMEKVREAQEQGNRFAFGIFLKETDRLIGDISIFDVRRGPLQKAILGYSMDKDHNGKGYMGEAVPLILNYSFDELKLHRVEAGARTDNAGSIRTLQKAGFQEEGISRKFMKINGEWHDHATFAILADDPR